MKQTKLVHWGAVSDLGGDGAVSVSRPPLLVMIILSFYLVLCMVSYCKMYTVTLSHKTSLNFHFGCF